MSNMVSLFFPDTTQIPVDELLELTGVENVVGTVDDTGRVLNYRIAWDNVTLMIEYPPDDEQAVHIKALLSKADALLDDRKDKKAKKIWRRVERMEQMCTITAAPDWDNERKAQHLVQGIMSYYDYAQMFVNGTIYNENGNIEVGHDDSEPKYWIIEGEDTDLPEAVQRKQRSIRQLKKEEVPTIEHLPVIQASNQVTLRELTEVAKRAMALNLIARRAEGKSYGWYQEKVKAYQLEDVITEEERAFAPDDEPEEYMILRFAQRYESYWALLWALGYTNNRLGRPDTFVDADRADQILESRTAEEFIKQAKLRDVDTVLDELDLHYRYHWATLDAELYGEKPPAKLEPVVIFERHYALNWLIHNKDEEWDWVTTDT